MNKMTMRPIDPRLLDDKRVRPVPIEEPEPAPPPAVKAELIEPRELVEEMEEPPLINLESLTKENLVRFAKAHFNHDLSERDNKPELIEGIRVLMGRRPSYGG